MVNPLQRKWEVHAYVTQPGIQQPVIVGRYPHWTRHGAVLDAERSNGAAIRHGMTVRFTFDRRTL